MGIARYLDADQLGSHKNTVDADSRKSFDLVAGRSVVLNIVEITAACHSPAIVGLAKQLAGNHDWQKDAEDAVVADPRKRLNSGGRSIVLHIVEFIVACQKSAPVGLGPQFADNQDWLKDAEDVVLADSRKSWNLFARTSILLHIVDFIVACQHSVFVVFEYQFADNHDWLKDAEDTILADSRISLDLFARTSVVLHIVDFIAACQHSATVVFEHCFADNLDWSAS